MQKFLDDGFMRSVFHANNRLPPSAIRSADYGILLVGKIRTIDCLSNFLASYSYFF